MKIINQFDMFGIVNADVNSFTGSSIRNIVNVIQLNEIIEIAIMNLVLKSEKYKDALVAKYK